MGGKLAGGALKLKGNLFHTLKKENK
jgi:hypothetical protein